MENISIRRAEEKDKEWIKKAMTDAWNSEMVVASKLFNTLTLPGFVAEFNGQLTGIATYNIANGRLEIVSLNSTKEGKGIGTALVERAKELAKERGLKSVWLVTSNDNIDSLRFYQKRGFRITKVYPNAIDKARKIKPEVPVIGKYGIPLKDALELEYIV
ncbi:MAG: GNAT family N-acetyltransferase [Candidatus Levybacteria bacterium]|nr:GNAT family N-acetyltransferase [Candidatus Levybacteria bacterium]